MKEGLVGVCEFVDERGEERERDNVNAVVNVEC